MPLRSRRARKMRPARSPGEALVLAARRGDIDAMRLAIDDGAANLNEALARAIRSDRPAAVSYLLERGATATRVEPGAPGVLGLQIASYQRHCQAIWNDTQKLAGAGIGSMLATSSGPVRKLANLSKWLSPLELAIECRRLECAKTLLERATGATPDGGHWHGALAWAAIANHAAMVQLLLDRGFSPSVPCAYLPWRATSSMLCLIGVGRIAWTNDGHPIYPPGPFGPLVDDTPLAIAARVGGRRIAKLMLRRGAEDPEGAVLLESVARGDAEIAKALLDAGVAIQPRKREIALIREHLDYTGAAAAEHKAVLELLREKGYKPGLKELRAPLLQWFWGYPGPNEFTRLGCGCLFVGAVGFGLLMVVALVLEALMYFGVL